MLTSPFYFHTIRNLMVGFGDLFNDIHTITLDSDGNVAKDIKVPISPARSQKYIARLYEEAIREEESEAPNIEIQLPRMSYEITSISPDPSRKLATLNQQIRTKNDINGIQKHYKQYSGNPYAIGIDLNLYTYHLDDMLQMVEQITPFFTPDFNITILDIPQLDIKRDIPIILESITPTDTSYDGIMEDYRMIQWTLSFSSSVYMYPPITDSEIIKKIVVNYKDGVTE